MSKFSKKIRPEWTAHGCKPLKPEEGETLIKAINFYLYLVKNKDIAAGTATTKEVADAIERGFNLQTSPRLQKMVRVLRKCDGFIDYFNQ